MNEVHRRSIAGSAAAALVLINFAGCSELHDRSDSGHQPTGGPPAMPSSRSGPTTEPTSLAPSRLPSAERPSSSTRPAPNPAPSRPEDQATAEKPVATRTGSIDDRRVRGNLYAVQRTGRTAVVNLLITKLNPADPPFRLRSLLNDGDPGVAARNQSAVDGLRLIDGNAGKLYLPATTGNGICLCSPASNTVFDNYDEVVVSVVFAAPPVAVAKVDVLIPVFGTVANVPVR